LLETSAETERSAASAKAPAGSSMCWKRMIGRGAVLDDLDLVRPQIPDRAARSVRHAHVEPDEIRARSEHRLWPVPRLLEGGLRHRKTRGEHQQREGANGHGSRFRES
jgi:hypothetical protein